MYIISATLSLIASFAMFIYLMGLKLDSSVKYQPLLFLFPIVLLIISIIFLKTASKGED